MGWYASHRNYDGQCVNPEGVYAGTHREVSGSAVQFRYHPRCHHKVTHTTPTMSAEIEAIMKLADIGDLNTFEVSGRFRKVSSWSFYDDDILVRTVYHYGTEMGQFHYDHGDGFWYFVPTSTGWGSASDQQGMNKILKNFGWRYRRNNGEARYERR